MVIVLSLVLAMVGLLFKVAHRGLVIGTLGPDYKLGLRTPATTANKEIWHQAHIAADQQYSLTWKIAFAGAGILFFIGFFFYTNQDMLWPVALFILALISVIIVYFRARSTADKEARQHLPTASESA